MANRRYADYSIKEASIEIISDCIKYGESKGWSGSYEQIDEIETICIQFNVYYVDNFNGTGTWRLKK